MALFGRRDSDSPAANANSAPAPKRPDTAGTGLPSRSLPKLVGALAVGFALYVAFTGQKAPPAAAPVAAPTPQTTAKPEDSQFGDLAKQVSGQLKSIENKHHHPPVAGSSSVDDSLPTPDNLKHSAQQGNIAASSIVALQGNVSLGDSSAHRPPSGNHSAQAANSVPVPQPMGPVTSSGLNLQYPPKQDTRPEGEKFLDRTAKAAGDGYGPRVKVLPKLPGAELFPGTVLPATTITTVNTELPGAVIAQVTQNVYGRNGRIAVPRGSRLVGRYDSQVTNGQTRVMVAFERVIFPDDRELVLGNAQSVGAQGASGNKAEVNNHFFKMLGASLLVAFLDEGVSAAGPQQQVTNGSGATFSGADQSAAQAFAQTGQKILNPYVNLQPTAVIPAGVGINVLVNKTVLIPSADGDPS